MAQEEGERGDGHGETAFCEFEGIVDENVENLKQMCEDLRVTNFTDRYFALFLRLFMPLRLQAIFPLRAMCFSEIISPKGVVNSLNFRQTVSILYTVKGCRVDEASFTYKVFDEISLVQTSKVNAHVRR